MKRRLACIPLLFCLVLLLSSSPGSKSPGYNQAYRPQFHFSPNIHWTNDPNGLIYFDGEYHLFFQFNPFGDEWGHMSWGHAVSTDLTHWTELPVAIPEQNGIMIFTGSAVVDEHNTSGFCQGGKPCMVAIYTGHTPAAHKRPALQTQNIAFSNDRGRTWTKYSGNPILNLHLSDFRDPKVFWSEHGHYWLMAVSLPNEHKISFYRSPNLKSWTHLGDFGPTGATGGQWECPELFELPVDGDAAQTKWVLKVGINPGALQGGSGEQYFVGHFDGPRFIDDTPRSETLWTDYGKDCYCALTFNDLPPSHPKVMMGWMDNWQYAAALPTSPWRGQMTIPRKLALHTTPDGLRLFQQPADELRHLRENQWSAQSANVDSLNRTLQSVGEGAGHTYELHANVLLGNAEEVGWKLLSGDGKYLLVSYNRTRRQLFVDRTHANGPAFSKEFPAITAAPLTPAGDSLSFHIFVDRSSVEVFGDNGRVTLTNLVFPAAEANGISFYAKGGQAGPVTLDAWKLRSIWPNSQ